MPSRALPGSGRVGWSGGARPSQVVVAIDIGATRTRAALVDDALLEVVRTTVPTPMQVGHDLGGHVASVVGRLVAQATAYGMPIELMACGVVVPGSVGEPHGLGVHSSALRWRDQPVGEIVRRAIGAPTVVGHDVRAALVAEARLGAARGARQAMLVHLDDSVTGALMVDGAVLSAAGWAGELGHLQALAGGPLCPCGGQGCLEVVASTAAVSRAYALRTGEQVAARTVALRIGQRDVAAQEVWAQVVSAMGRVVLTTVSITGIDLVLVGGGLALSGETLLAPLRREIDRVRTAQRPPRVVRAALGDRAACLGAAITAWQSVRRADP